MSERYADCSACRGMGSFRIKDNDGKTIDREECKSCDGTGIGGSALDYCQNELNKERPSVQRILPEDDR